MKWHLLLCLVLLSSNHFIFISTYSKALQLIKDWQSCRLKIIEISNKDPPQFMLSLSYIEEEVLGEGCIGLVKSIRRKSDSQVFAVKTVKTTDEEIVKNV